MLMAWEVHEEELERLPDVLGWDRHVAQRRGALQHGLDDVHDVRDIVHQRNELVEELARVQLARREDGCRVVLLPLPGHCAHQSHRSIGKAPMCLLFGSTLLLATHLRATLFLHILGKLRFVSYA